MKKSLIELASRRAHVWAGAAAQRVRATQDGRPGDGERGDVPGWVLVTLMTAGLVIALWAVAGKVLPDLFGNAIDSVKGP
ncbi:hypothetical protein GCM10025864_44020 [Luteimicrobium album]|uniref:Uncharacterized protein n=1 Tax=Luteimicrobium album TaxID=1054550 RepID=A0ABQ6I909_9MICO|nr:hypothetical protein [Luteimicrobium album]GMA26643.1 hypothetical protein GCM10025864_44020 [Luteimicrobium album]